MYETVKTVKGYDVYRMKGTHGCYWVALDERHQIGFKTIKAAAAYIEENL